jgi:hypothetical protein
MTSSRSLNLLGAFPLKSGCRASSEDTLAKDISLPDSVIACSQVRPYLREAYKLQARLLLLAHLRNYRISPGNAPVDGLDHK